MSKKTVRVSPNANKPHHHDEDLCAMIETIIPRLPDISHLKEPYDPKRWDVCRHNCLCYQVDCCFAHTFTLEARKQIRKAVNKEKKVQKIKGEIEKVGEKGFEKAWGDY